VREVAGLTADKFREYPEERMKLKYYRLMGLDFDIDVSRQQQLAPDILQRIRTEIRDGGVLSATPIIAGIDVAVWAYLYS